MTPVRFIALVVCSALACIAFVGCASLEKTTMQTEFTLSAANSMCFHVLDSVDADVTDKIRVQDLNGDHAGAVQAYADYKPKIEASRNACNASDDVVQNADKARLAIPKGGDVKAFTAWLPALSATLVLVQQAIADVKGLVH